MPKVLEMGAKLQTILIGAYIHALTPTQLEMVQLGALAVNENGILRFKDCLQLYNSNAATKALYAQDLDSLETLHSKKVAEYELTLRSRWQEYLTDDTRWIRLGSQEFIIPGMIDTHTHAPQYVNSGIGLDMPLLDWLQCYTFPRETEFQDPNVADWIYPAAVRRHLSFGTTTCCYYGTIHLEANKRLVDIIEHLGQRAFIGKVNMDRHSPPGLTEETQQSIEETKAFVEYVQAKKNSTLVPIITPRFAPSCSSECMKALSELAKLKHIPIQTHLSENLKEIEWVKDLFPGAANYTSVYDQHGLLTSRTILAHCIHLSDDEKALIRERGAGVSHCPNSNFGISSGICNVLALTRAGIKVGLGTDVSGGHHPSMMDSMKYALLASKVLTLPQKDGQPSINDRPLNLNEAFYLATMGSADLCGIQDVVGNFVIGKEFDAVLTNMKQLHQLMEVPHSEIRRQHHAEALVNHSVHSENNVDLWHHDDLRTSFEKFIYLGDDRNIQKVWVKGRLVKGKYE